MAIEAYGDFNANIVDWSDAAFCGVWTVSTPFGNVPFFGTLGLYGLTAAHFAYRLVSACVVVMFGVI